MEIFLPADAWGSGNTSLDAGSSGGPGGQEQNHTGLLDMFSGTELLLRFKPLFLPLYCLLVAVAAVGNCFLLACISSDKKLHNATNFFIGNLAAGDLLMCLSCVPLTASYALDRGGWAFGQPLCYLVPLLQGATVFASALSLTAIAVDRYIVVAHPVRRRISVRGCGGVALGIWCLSLALAAPPSFYTRYLDLRPSGMPLVVCEEFWPSSGHLRLLYSCFILSASYMIPLLAVSVSYCAISGSLRRHALPPGETSRSQERWSRRRRKTFSLLVASVLAFALCWLPLQVLNLLLDLDPDFHIVGKRYINLLQVCCHLVAMSSTCYNPFIYASLHSKVRQHLRGYLCYCRRRAAPREGGAGVHGETLTSPCASRHTGVHGETLTSPCASRHTGVHGETLTSPCASRHTGVHGETLTSPCASRHTGVHGETLTSPCASRHTGVHGDGRRTPGSTPCPAVAVLTDDALFPEPLGPLAKSVTEATLERTG